MYSYSPKSKRKRGVILSPDGWQRLQLAQSQSENQSNASAAYTIEDLNQLTGLSSHTITKIKRRQIPVDIQSLECYFQAFGLQLTSQDFIRPRSKGNPAPEQNQIAANPSSGNSKPTLPEGQVPLGSPYYLYRPPTETSCFETVTQPGSLIRIKAPRRMGKSSLMARILEFGQEQGYRTVFLSLQMAERELFQDLDRFLRWFSASVCLGIGLTNNIDEYWDELFGSKISCKIYFEEYLLPQRSQPLLLALDDVDRLFEYPDLADEFFGLLRTWHEQGKNQAIWQQLRLIVAHSTEVYIPLNVNKSPFNVGLPVELPLFTTEQVTELTTRYGIQWTEKETQQLTTLTAGQPYLTQLALYRLQQNSLSLKQLVTTAATSEGIYSEHLRRLWWTLEQNPQLASAFAEVLQHSEPIKLELHPAFKLESLGLVKLKDNKAIPSCSLYRDYFQKML